MPPVLRSFSDVLAIFQASNPKKKLKSHAGLHYAAEIAWSFKSLKSWPTDPPVSALVKVRDPRDHDEDVLKGARALVSYANFGNAIGTWNSGGTGSYVCGEDWILAQVELTQEQADDDYEGGAGDYVSLILAVWRLSDGWAAAILRDDERALAASLLGLEAWPQEGWETEKVWFGE